MNEQWVPIRYRDFYDFPRAFMVERGGDLLFFDCPFRDAFDDYGEEYTVFCIKDELRDRAGQMPWTDLVGHSDRIGVVPTKAVKFDETRRRAINADVFALIDEAAKKAE